MAQTYQSDREGALVDIADAGAQAKLRRKVGTAPPVDYPCPVLIMSFTSFEIDGQLIRRGDLKVMVPAESFPAEFVPNTETDRLIIDDPRPDHAASNGDYRLTFSHPFMPGGRPIYYDMGARK